MKRQQGTLPTYYFDDTGKIYSNYSSIIATALPSFNLITVESTLIPSASSSLHSPHHGNPRVEPSRP